MNDATRRQLAGVAVFGAVVFVASLAVSPSRLFAAAIGLADSPTAFALVVLAFALCRPLVAWPVGLLAGLIGYAAGPGGAPLALAAAVVTTLPPYLIARIAEPTGGPFGWAGAAGADLFATTGDARGVLAARLAPLPTDVVSYGAGLAAVPLRPFLLGTAVGELPWVIAGVLAGSSMETLTTEGLSAGLPVAVGAAAVAALLLAGPLYQQVSGRAAAE